MKTEKLFVVVFVAAFFIVLGWFIYRVGGIHAYCEYQAARWCSFTSVNSIADYIVWCKNSLVEGLHIMF